MREFTENTRVWTVRHCREFSPFRKYLLSPRRHAALKQWKKIGDFLTIFPVPKEKSLNALNAMKKRIAGGEKIYTPLENKDVAVYSFAVHRGKPFVLILPGGGYSDVCSVTEGFPVALKLNSLGYNAYVGQYRVGKKAHYPAPQDDVADILKHIFKIAAESGVCADGYAVCGFSAGGHLAACWGTKSLGYLKYGVKKPSALMLAYPVINMDDSMHEVVRKNLFGKEFENKELQKKYSVHLLADKDFPKTFMWQCKNDCLVPFDNTVLLSERLKEVGCEYYHLKVEGNGHGWGLGEGTPAEGWLEKAVNFWQGKKNDKPL